MKSGYWHFTEGSNKSNMPKSTTWKNITWHLISYENQDSSLVGSLRPKRLHHFLKQKGLTTEFISRISSSGEMDKVIEERKTVSKWKKFFNVIALPDASFFWSISVFNYLKQKETPFIAITSLPPFGLCWLGLLLKRTKKKVFWVLDLRDTWTLNPLYKPFLFVLKMPLIHLLEYHAFQKADVILLNTDTDLDAYTKKYPFISNKSITVRNGFDEWLENKSVATKDDVITLVYAGGAYARGEAPLAISSFLEKINAGGQQVFCDYYGEHHPKLQQSRYIQYKGTFPQKDIPGILAQYKMGIIYLPEENISSGRITQKFYEHMTCLGLGVVVFPAFDPTLILQKIKHFYSASIPIEKEKLIPYTRAYQFEQMLRFTIEKYTANEK
jgi:hypothetical protein